MMPSDAVRAIFRSNLGVKRTERVLVFTDRTTPREDPSPEDRQRREKLGDMANLAAEIARGLVREVVFVRYPALGGHGMEPPARLWEAAFGRKAVDALRAARLLSPVLSKRASAKQLDEAGKVLKRHGRRVVDAVVALSNFSTSHTAFRGFLTGLFGARYASMPLFDFSMLYGPMDVDYRALARRTRALAKALSRASHVEVSAPNGTALRFETGGRKALADTGVLTRPGSFGNLPAGEAFIAPLEGTAEGTLVLEWAPTRRLSPPVTLRVQGGKVTEVQGGEEFAGVLRGRLSEREENSNIAELGIGTNQRAKRPDNVLESEKIMGTVHVALGDNSTFGGAVKAPFHQDFVFFRPSVSIVAKGGLRGDLLVAGSLAGEFRNPI